MQYGPPDTSTSPGRAGTNACEHDLAEPAVLHLEGVDAPAEREAGRDDGPGRGATDEVEVVGDDEVGPAGRPGQPSPVWVEPAHQLHDVGRQWLGDGCAPNMTNEIAG